MSYDYDIALSFAGEDRDYVEKVADALNAIGIKVFYDKYETAGLWGKNPYTHLKSIYHEKSKYCVIFISKYYKEKVWTNHERESAQARSLFENNEYILPARFDDTVLPGLLPTISYINLNDLNPSEFAYIIAKKIKPEIDIEEMLSYFSSHLKGYNIFIKETSVVFERTEEDFYAEYPVRLMLEMYRLDQWERMFLLPGIVPW